MSNTNIASIGRFSSQMLTYLGTQRTVKDVGGPYNTYKYATSPTTFPNPSSLSQSMLGDGVVGAISPASYNSTQSYFLSRGTGNLYADTMSALAIDMAYTLGISTQKFLEKSETSNQISLSPESYTVFNALRDPSHQVGIVTTVLNKTSLQARAIRS